MKLEVLLSTMGQTDYSIVDAARIQSDAIIINQADRFQKEVIEHNGHQIQMLTFDERGVGLSRNNALMRSSGDIVLFGDEDICYVDGYADKIITEFNNNPKADMIVFNVPSDNPERPTYHISRRGRVRFHNCLRYGAVRMAVRTQKLKQKNLYFSLLFGGGAKYSSGEDSLFIYSAIKSGLKVYASPTIIGTVSQDSSTWFQGYTDKFFLDKGVLYRTISPVFFPIYVVRYIFRTRKLFSSKTSVLKALKLALVDSRNHV